MGDISLPSLNKGMARYGREGALSLQRETWSDPKNRRIGEQEEGGGDQAGVEME